MARNAVYGKGSGNLFTNPKVPSAFVSKDPTSGSVVNLVDYRTLEWTFTADQFYDFLFPYYYDGGMLRSVWVYKGLKVDKWFNGNVVLHSSDYVGGVMTEFTIVMNVDDYVEIYQGGRSEQWGDYGYNVGRNIYWGNIGSWTPPAAHTVYYED